MLIYFINIFLIIICTLSKKTFSIGSRYIDRKKKDCIIFSFLWIILSGFRGLSVGPDTWSYGVDFERIINTPWTVLWNNLIAKTSGIESLLANNQLNKDPGFPILTKLISIFFPTYRLYLIFVAVFFMVLFGRFLYKNCQTPFLGFIMFDCLFYNFYAITGIRQTIATALIVLLGYDYIKNRKLGKFLIVSAFAFLIHKSSLCFVPFYFLSRIKVNRITITVASVLIATSFVYKRQLMSFLSVIMGYEQYNQQWQYNDGGPLTFTLLLFAVFAFCCVFKNRMLENDEDFQYKFIALTMALLFLPLAFIDPSAMRVSYYYAIFLMILLPDVVYVFDERQQILVTVGITFVMMLLLFSNKPEYIFCWME